VFICAVPGKVIFKMIYYVSSRVLNFYSLSPTGSKVIKATMVNSNLVFECLLLKIVGW